MGQQDLVGSEQYLTIAFRHALPDVTFLALHPGWVDTDMGSVVGAPPTKPSESVQALRDYGSHQRQHTLGRVHRLHDH